MRGKIVADIACGSGYGSELLAHSGAAKVIGIDNDPAAIAYARQHHYHPAIEFRVADAVRTELPTCSFDIVASLETLEHLQPQAYFIEEMWRILRDGGLFLVSTPDKELSLEDNPYHAREMNCSELLQLLAPRFPKISLFGQRPVSRWYVQGLKKVLGPVPPGYCRWLLTSLLYHQPFRDLSISQMANERASFMYLLALCQK